MKENISVFTIIAKNYYPQAASFAESYHQIHPDHHLFVFFIDNDCIYSSKIYQAVPLKKVDTIKNLSELSFKYNITEFATAVKPYIFLWLFKKYKSNKILYFDPDIYIYQKIDRIIDELDQHDCVLIPHRTKPTKDNKKPNEWDFMSCGYYNLGFVGFRNSKNVKTFLRWWSKKLDDFAYADTKNFMFTDQKWMDYAPSFLDTYILRDKGYDVAYWNLHEYLDHIPTSKICFFHFSGFVPEKNILSKHQNRFTLENIGEYKKLFSSYAESLSLYKNQHKGLSSYIYPYGYFDNGIEITQQTKDIYRYATTHENQHFLHLYKTTGRNSFFSYLIKIIYISNDTKILNYFLLLNKSHDDIAKEFSLDQPYKENTFNAYITWLFTFSKSIYNTPDFFLLNQKRISPLLSNTKFNPKIPLNYLDVISSLEKLKKSKGNSELIMDAYRIILHRNPDDEGYQKNLNDLDHFRASRNFFLFRLFNSLEFYYKHGHCFLSPITLYRLWLFFLSAKFFVIDRPLNKNKKNYKNTKNSTHKDNFLSNTGWNISGYLDTESGVGESARGFIRVFDKIKTPVNLNNIEQPWLRREDKTYANRFTKGHQYYINLICVNAEQAKPVIETQLGLNYVKNKYNIGYWYWESDIFPEAYEESFRTFNEIWTATSYVQSAISLKSPKPVICIPPAFISPKISSIPRFNFKKYSVPVENKDFIFLNIFDSASIWQRKNPFGLIQAFSKAFSGKPGIKLIIKTTQIKKSDIYSKLKQEIGQNKQIYLVDGYLKNVEIMSLLNDAHCFVNLHRAEGLGVPLINSHLLGKPVIATNFSANKDFETAENSFLVNFKPYILDKPIGPYPKDTSWADPDPDHAAFQMKKVYEMDASSLAKISQRGKQEVEYFFSPQRIARLINLRLPTINKFFWWI